jgi:SagB-type dehydrogenase family enzyme
MTVLAAPTIRGEATRRYLQVADRQPMVAILSTDWRHRPATLKRYPRAAAIALPPPGNSADPLSRLLAYSYGLTRYRWDGVGLLPGARFGGMPAAGRPHRPAASGGGLYPSELYLLTGDGWGGGRDAAVLHYDPAAHALDPIRAGDWRDSEATSLLTVAITSVFARTAFKYKEFGFRLQCLDAGVLAGQVLTEAQAAGLTGRLRLRFDDTAIAAALGTDPDREVSLALIDIDIASTVSDSDTPAPPAADPAAQRRAANGGLAISLCETAARPEAVADFATAARQPSARTTPPPALDSVPLTRELYRSARETRDAAWPDPIALEPPLPVPADRIGLPEPKLPTLSAGTTRRRTLDGRFGVDATALGDLAAVLHAAFAWPETLSRHLVALCAVHRVDGLRPGLYHYRPATHDLLLLRQADLRVAMSPPDPGNARFLGDHHGAGAALVPLGDYERGLAAAGDRWFQMQNVPAGMVIQRATLAGAALGLDCRIVCAFDVDHLAAVLGLQGGPLRPLCQILIGSTGTDVGYDQPL